MMERVGIVGAGMAGLAVARELKAAGVEAVLLEKARGVGGRVHTRNQEGFIWDTGATSIAPRGKRIEKVLLEELEPPSPIFRPIWTHEGLRVRPGDTAKNSTPRFCHTQGIQTFAKLLSEGLDVRFNTTVEKLDKEGDLYKIGEETFTHLVLTPPIPQTAQLLWTIDESRPIANAKYRPCLSVLLGYDLETPEVDYHALLDPTQSHPLTWLSIENLKSPGRMEDGKTALVAQLSSRFSQESFAKDDEWIAQVVTSFLATLYGAKWKNPSLAFVKKWKYSQPDNLARFETVNVPGSRLLLASDGLMGGRIEEAYEAGAKVADLILGRATP